MYKSDGRALGVEILNSATPLIQTQPRRLPMESMYYIGLDVHKKTISYCVRMEAVRFMPKARFQQRASTWTGG
jgi:hypothetical protein